MNHRTPKKSPATASACAAATNRRAADHAPRTPGMTVPQILLLVGGAAGLLVVAAVLYLLFGRGPRRSRAYQRGQKLLHQGQWQPALDVFRKLQDQGRLSAQWQGKL